MSITAERKQVLIREYAPAGSDKAASGSASAGLGAADTGASEVQISILSERIANLTEHCRTHSKDKHSLRGLLKLVSRRRRLLDYLKNHDENRHKDLITRLGLRR